MESESILHDGDVDSGNNSDDSCDNSGSDSDGGYQFGDSSLVSDDNSLVDLLFNDNTQMRLESVQSVVSDGSDLLQDN